ncbi:MAG TPA: eL32 family ribosomal protein [Candidatus Nanoarchaeia archaeon]|nr:eL32 family ribosomal protein [Candidatus Nanoarchaeia archaeon]
MSSDIKRLLSVRKEMKRKKPRFIRPDYMRLSNIAWVWRKPRGLHNKMRRHMRSVPADVNIGYRGPAAVRGLSSDGKKLAVIANLAQLIALPKDTIAEIRGSVGDKKRQEIMKEAQRRNIRIKNVHDTAKALAKIDKEMADRKERKKTLVAKKATQKKTEKKQDAPKKEEQPAKDQAQEEQKKDQDKTLTKRI